MKRSDVSQFFLPQRQAPNALIFIVLRTLRRLLAQLWPFLLIFFFSGPDYGSLFFVISSIVFSSGVLISSIIAYYRFYYYIDNERLHIQKGIFRRSHTNVPLQRIQNVQIEDNLIHRMFDTVRVHFSTAGSTESEFSIESMNSEDAAHLRSYILRLKKTMKKEQEGQEEKSIDAEEDFQTLFQLNLRDLLKVGLSQNHFRAIGIILGALGYLLSQAQEFLRDDIFDWAYSIFNWGYQADYLIIFLLLVAVLLIALTISMVSVFFRFYQLKVELGNQQIRLRHGWIQRREQTAQIRKIQILDWSTNPVRRAMNIVTVILRQATSSSDQAQNTLFLPGASRDQSRALEQKVFPNIQVEKAPVDFHSSMVWRYTLFRGAIPALIAVAASYNLFGWYSLFFLTWILVSWLINLQVYRNWSVEWDEQHVSLQRGFWSFSVSTMPWHKIQSLEFKQSPFQHSRDIGNLWIYTAGGSLKIPYISRGQAFGMKDYALYKAESSKKPWM